MAFNLVYLSQVDPQWTNDTLGFGQPGKETIGKFGCAITSIAMLLSGHGYPETPKTLNQKLQAAQGFTNGAEIRWDVVCRVHPEVRLKPIAWCMDSDAPLAQIDAALAAGQPVVVLVDSDADQELDWHYVLLYARQGEDYLMLDPYPYQPGTNKSDLLSKRYGYGRPLSRTIRQVLFYEVPGGAAPGPTPTSTTTSTSTPQPTTTTGTGVYARVLDSVSLGLNIRSSTDTSSLANLVINVPAGTQLLLVDANDAAKIGQSGQWVRVHEPGGKEGFAAAWFLEKAAAPASVPGPTPGPVGETPAPTPATPTSTSTPSTPSGPSPVSTPAQPAEDKKLTVLVSDAVGTGGLRMRKTPSLGGALVMVLKAGTRLTVVEPAGKAKAKVGQPNQWLYIREPNGARGYVGAQFVKLA